VPGPSAITWDPIFHHRNCGKFRNAHKFANTFVDNFFSGGTGAPLLLSQFSNKLTNNNYYDGAYKLGPTLISSISITPLVLTKALIPQYSNLAIPPASLTLLRRSAPATS